MARVVIPEEEFYKKESKDENAKINELARIQIKLDLYAYMHRDEIEEIRKKIVELSAKEKTSEKKQSLLQEIKELEIRYKVFQMYRDNKYVEEKDWEDLYKVKFDILMCDINKSLISAFEEIGFDEQELVYYDKILTEKISKILTGENQELQRAFGTENMPQAIKIIRSLLMSEDKTFNTYAILQDIKLLRLILAFDKEMGLDEIVLNCGEIKGFNKVDFEWEDTIPLYSINQIVSNSNYKYYGHIESIDNLILQLYRMYQEYNEIETETENLHWLPEGIKEIKKFRGANLGFDEEYEVICPSTLKSIADHAFESENLIGIIFNEGLSNIDESAFNDTEFMRIFNTILDDAKEVVPNDLPETFIERIKNKEDIKRKLIEHVNMHCKEEIERIKQQIKELELQLHSQEGGEQLLEKLDNLKKRCNIFIKYIKDEELKNLLYEVKFEVYMLELEKKQESPLSNLDRNSEEYKFYIGIVKRKVFKVFNKLKDIENSLFNDKNKERARKILSNILGSKITLQDRNALVLFQALESGKNIQEINILIPKDEAFNRCYCLTWGDYIPLSSIIKIENDPEYEVYKRCIVLNETNPYIQLCRTLKYNKKEKDGKYKTHKIPEGITSISRIGGVFPQGVGLLHEILKDGYQRVECPSTLQNIWSGAFAQEDSLEEVVLNEGLKYIGPYAFKLSGIRTLKIPSTVEEINEQAFCGTNIETVSIPSTVKWLGGCTFSYCRNLKRAVINVEVRSRSEFDECHNIEEMIITPKVEELSFYLLSDSSCKKVIV